MSHVILKRIHDAKLGLGVHETNCFVYMGYGSSNFVVRPNPYFVYLFMFSFFFVLFLVSILAKIVK